MVQSKEEEQLADSSCGAAQRHRHIGGCININAIFHHFLQGRSRFAAPPPGYKGSLDDTPHANETSHISMMKNSKSVIDKPRLSTDSSRSSVSSSCNSSSFFSSSIEDTKITHQSSETTTTQQAPSDISKLVRDSILHRDVRGITVKAASKGDSLTYVDSPRPSLPSPKPNNNPKRFSGIRESLGALPTFHKSGIERSSSLLHKESPRYSYDGRDSRPAVKIKELPRYSLDSKRPNCPSNTNQELSGSHRRRQTNVVVKLMGLEELEEPEKVVGSLQISDPKQASRSSRIVPVEWKSQELEETQCLASQGNISSVYGQMEKRLGQLEFGKSGKDLRALKHILQSMHNSKKIREGGTGTETETCSTPKIKKTCSPKNMIRTPKAIKKTETAKVSVSIVVPVPGLRKLDLGDKKTGGKKFLDEKRSGCVEKTKNPRKTASPRLQKKKPNLSDSPGSKNSASSQKSRSHRRDPGSELSGSDSLSEQNNGISLQSDGGGISLTSSQEEMEVSSEYRPKKMELVEQLSPVSVLDARFYEDESPSPVKMISNAFEANTPPSKGRECISEILFASDLFSNLDSASLILPNTFLALEETKSNNFLERRLVFDVVTEILRRKFESYGPISSNFKLETREQVLKGLCKEIEELPCKLDEEDEDCFRSMVEKELNGDSVGWTDVSCDISGVAVDIERMIFRDLISEVVNPDVRTRGSSYRRKLF